MKEEITVVEEKMGKEIEKIKEQVEERIEGVAENFSLISHRMEDLKKKLLAGENENKSKIVPVSAFPEPVLACPLPVTAFTEILQGLRTPANENKTPENRRKLAGVCLRSRKAPQLGFLRPPSNCVRNNLLTVFRGRPERGGSPEGSSRRDRQSAPGARVTLDAPCESPWKSDIEKLRDEFQSFKAQRQNQEKRNFKCWGCGGTGHLRRNCPRSRKDENTVSSSKQEN
ncbi:hypothetical protein TNCV_1693471 [Trichonephila clavipes]|nr:hypothetical protein TNCV_1693471 [Trichonephila clavipes]